MNMSAWNFEKYEWTKRSKFDSFFFYFSYIRRKPNVHAIFVLWLDQTCILFTYILIQLWRICWLCSAFKWFIDWEWEFFLYALTLKLLLLLKYVNIEAKCCGWLYSHSVQFRFAAQNLNIRFPWKPNEIHSIEQLHNIVSRAHNLHDAFQIWHQINFGNSNVLWFARTLLYNETLSIFSVS